MPQTKDQFSRSVLIVGAGIAGMQAALDLAAMGHEVFLSERSATIGGNMARLDKTFPTNDCSMCMISPRMVACSRHPLIHILTHVELHNVVGEPGRFTCSLEQIPRYVDEKVCIGCGQCVEKCPKKVLNSYNASLDHRKAIYFVHPQAIPMVPAIDTDNCIYFQRKRCRACEKICPTQAIRFDEQSRSLELTVGAVIVAAGFELGLVPQAGEYGHGRYSNVVTNLEYERMLSATGPFAGHLKRPSDGGQVRRVAWIQCVASRDSARARNFCSSVCCMAAVKQAVLTREHLRDSEATIFFMDMRAHGKEFDSYVSRAEESYGVRLVRSMLSQVIQDPQNQNLIIEYYDRRSIRQHREEFDVVVLSAGFKPSPGVLPLLQGLGVTQNRYGFVTPNLVEPTRTSKRGIFACGTIDGPKDIPESVTSASAAAAGAAALLHQLAPVPQVAAEPAIFEEPQPASSSAGAQRPESAAQPPRIGIFVCHCGKNIAGVVQIEAVCDYARTLPDVVVAEDFLFTCATQTQHRIKELIQRHQLNRVVVAACSPRTHEPLFQQTLAEAGLNKYLFEMANIRDQCSWVHGCDPAAATAKAKELAGRAIARARVLEPIEETVCQVVPKALVIGGGLAGMSAALALAEQGIESVLVEQDQQLGGIAREIHRTLEGQAPRDVIERMTVQLQAHPSVSVHIGTKVQAVNGGAGRFNCVLVHDSRNVSAAVGAIIVATGGQPYRPAEYGYGEHSKVMTQLELEKRLFAGDNCRPRTTVMIQCVGSRREDFPMCSRICCAAAVKNAIVLMERNPEGSVYILYRDIRTFGFKEDFYRQARDLGVVFVNFDPTAPPQVDWENGDLTVTLFDPTIQMELRIEPELLVLSSGVRPRSEAVEIGEILKLPRNQEGFFLEAHPKLSPLDFSNAGIYLCGLAHSPRFMEETIAQAKGAACRAAGLLLQKELRASGVIAEVDRERCCACLVCVKSCPYQVPVIDEQGVSSIDPRSCHGCGICAAECPAKAITLRHYTDKQIIAQATGP